MDDVKELEELELVIAREAHTEAKLKYLKDRASVIGTEVLELQKQMEYEFSDVDRLEGINLVSIFYDVIGKKVEELEKQKREALVATEKYKLASIELRELMSDVGKCERELRHIARCKEKYNELWNRILQGSGEADKENNELMLMRREALRIEARLREIDEAIAEGDKVFENCDSIIEHIERYYVLMNTRTRNTSCRQIEDALNNLKIADNKLASLPAQLSRFRAELSDVGLVFEGDENEDGFNHNMVGGSCFFNIVDNTVNSQFVAVRSLKGRISRVLFALSEKKDRLNKILEDTKEKIKNNF